MRDSQVGGQTTFVSISAICIFAVLVLAWAKLSKAADAQPVDPEELLNQFDKRAIPQLWPMSGGIFVEHADGPSAFQVDLWERLHANEEDFDPRVKDLIAAGQQVLPQIHKRLKAQLPAEPLTSHLILVLRSIGNAESIPILIKLLERMPEEAALAGNGPSSITRLAATSALWKLTGRKHVFSVEKWSDWWHSVEPDFIPERDRQQPGFQARVKAERVDRLIHELATNEAAARERLVVLGPAALPPLMDALNTKMPLVFDESVSNADKQSLFRLAWVIDELGATAKLQVALRRDYFIERFSDNQNLILASPIEDDAACRALIHCSFADFCTICLAVDQYKGNQQMHWMSYWMSGNRDIVHRRLGKKGNDSAGRGSSRLPYWNQIAPLQTPAVEIGAAAPILIKALNEQDPNIRRSAINLSEIIGFCSDEKPEALIVALRDAWLSETDDRLRSNIGLAMSRFGTPFVIQAISDGLRSDRLEIVSEAAGLVDWIPIERTNATQADFDRLVELTHHENDRLRYRAVRSLRGKAPSLLETEFDRLVKDPMKEIRSECALALRSNPDPKFAEVLFTLLDDENEQVRLESLSSISSLNHPPSMERLLPCLRDQKIHGFAVSALASMGGRDAIPLLIAELQSGNDVGGMIYQHLVLLTQEQLESKPEPWIAWWRKQRLLRSAAKRAATQAPAAAQKDE